MRIQNNIAAMTAHRNMSIANAGNARSQEKLSSGLRINRAGDDAAGLSISEKMRGQIRGLNQASRNAQDGISLIQTAEGALNESQNILQRMRELAVQAANDTNTLADRNAIGAEIEQLFEEIDRIADTTQFNEMNLLDGGFGCIGTGIDRADVIRQDRINSVLSQLTGNLVDFDTATVGEFDNDGFEPPSSGDTDLSTALLDAAFNSISREELNSIIAGVSSGAPSSEISTIFADIDGTIFDDFSDFTNALENLLAADPAEPEAGEITADTANAVLTAVTTAMRNAVETALTNLFLDPHTNAGANDLENAILGLNASDSGILLGAVDDANQDIVVVNDANTADIFALDVAIGGGTGPDGISISEFRDLVAARLTATELPPLTREEQAEELARSNAERKFHIGANSGQQVGISIANSTASALFEVESQVDDTDMNITQAAALINNENSSASERILAMFRFSEATAEGVTEGDREASFAEAVIAAISGTLAFAQTQGSDDTLFQVSVADARNLAIDAIDHAIAQVSERRSDLGAVQNRLEHTIRNLDVASENLLSAEARIRDVDMASEVMEQTRTNILQQAAQSMLAMANQQPQSVLQLLG